MQKKIRKRTGIMELFGAYSAGDYDKCIQIASNPTNSNLVKHTRTYFKAKILLAQGEYDKARELFNSLATDVPQLNIGKISAQILSNMDNQKENPAKVELTTDASIEYDDAVIYPSIWRGRKVISYSLLAVAMFIALLPVFMQINAANEYNAQMAAFMEDIRVMVEEDHDGVEVLEVFSLMHGEENVDEMFIYKTETHIIAGVLFTYEGQEDEMFYETQARIPLESLSRGRTTLLRFSFPTEVTDHQVYGYFYLGESDLPEEYIQMSSFEVDGKKVYFVVTEIYDK